ncbi:MAG TPA: hypothetical protein VGS23_01575, partial [Thermoplasmata archaeon]|nr:hypothetical protein [Thermoplasmata archaeon]
MRRPNATPVAILVGLSISVLLAGFTFDRGVPPTQTFRGSRCGVASGSELWTLNATPDLPPSFANGSVQAFGVNSSDVVVGGVSFFSRDRTPYDSLPALGSFTPSSPGSRDLTNTTGRYFDEGGVFPVAWNGTAWLIAGQTTLDGQTFGAAIAVQGGKVTDLTPKVAPFFQGQGIWIAGWDGNGWLLGGNDTRGAVLVYLKGGTVTNLTPVLPNNSPGDWVQMVAWNGTAWLIGGERV